MHLEAAFAKTTGALLSERQPGGHWTGKLSSSALSTATAVCALAIYRRHAREPAVATNPLILRGLEWLARQINPDGGWGDTDMSMSNLSTTALCWAAFGVADESKEYSQTVDRAEGYLRGAAGGIGSEAIARAVTARYGNDRTFSVPILVTCALSGRFGTGPEAWREIRPLPFELGALPREWFGAMRLPVVSYALPALIALGQVIHHYRPSLNPLTRWLRNLTRRPTLRVLSEIQPSNGGFLEATPLTSFVTMSLAAAGLANHSVTLKGIDFLVRSVQDNGSWPIDTNLSTWLTTLSINAMPGSLISKIANDCAPGCLRNSSARRIPTPTPRPADGLGPICPAACPTRTTPPALSWHCIILVISTQRSAPRPRLASAGCLICKTATVGCRLSAEAGALCCSTAAAPT